MKKHKGKKKIEEADKTLDDSIGDEINSQTTK